MKYSILALLAMVQSTEAMQLRRDHLEDDDVPHSHDFAKGDQNNKDTHKMSQYEVEAENTFHQGNFNTGTKSETSAQAVHSLPGAYDIGAPTNQPVHKERGELAKSKLFKPSKSGVSLLYVTIDSPEHA